MRSLRTTGVTTLGRHRRAVTSMRMTQPLPRLSQSTQVSECTAVHPSRRLAGRTRSGTRSHRNRVIVASHTTLPSTDSLIEQFDVTRHLHTTPAISVPHSRASGGGGGGGRNREEEGDEEGGWYDGVASEGE